FAVKFTPRFPDSQVNLQPTLYLPTIRYLKIRSISPEQDDFVCKGVETHVRSSAEDAVLLVGDGSASKSDADLATANNTLPRGIIESQDESLVCHRDHYDDFARFSIYISTTHHPAILGQQNEQESRHSGRRDFQDWDCVDLFLSCGKDVVAAELAGWTLKSSLLLAGLPACLYATQGVLTYLGYQNTDSITFNGLNQTKTLSAALWCYLLMGKRQSLVQMVALAILFFSALLFNGTLSLSGLFNRNAEGKCIAEEVTQKTSVSKGVLPCVGAAFISGLAGALSQKGVQVAGGKGRNAYLYTMELGLYSSIALITSIFATKNGREAIGNEEGGIFKYWTFGSFIPVAVRALGGILTALVHKHAGATRKGFALILGLIMTGICQSVVEGEKLSTDELSAMVLVIMSSYLHITFPPLARTTGVTAPKSNAALSNIG
ncbi:hypothetical protein THAOC_03340, partial [Thalassiosira oceanica]